MSTVFLYIILYYIIYYGYIFFIIYYGTVLRIYPPPPPRRPTTATPPLSLDAVIFFAPLRNWSHASYKVIVRPSIFEPLFIAAAILGDLSFVLLLVAIRNKIKGVTSIFARVGCRYVPTRPTLNLLMKL